MMMDQFTMEDIQRHLSSQRHQRRRRKCEADDSGDVWTAVLWKERTKVPVPTHAKQSELLQVAIERKFPKTKMAVMRRELRSRRHVFDRTFARHLQALNPYAGGRWAECLGQAIEAAGAGGSLWFVTIIDDAWMLPTYPVGPSEDELRAVLSEMRRTVRPGLRGASYLLQADFALRRHVASSYTDFEIHWHGFVWGGVDLIARLEKRFPANKFGAPGFLAIAVYDLAGALSYTTKDSRLGYITVENFKFRAGTSRWKEWFHHREPFTGPKRLLLMNAFGNLTKPELCAASGAGLVILREAKRLARERGYRKTLKVS